MILFDEKFIHCLWSDELRGKKCFAADNIYDLMHDVCYNVDSVSVSDYDEQFGFEINHTDYHLLFVYYDPNYDIKWAFHNGDTIYHKNKNIISDGWHPFNKSSVDEYFEFDFKNYDYQLRYEKKQEDRAFNNTNELIAYWESHYCNAGRPENTMPLIWVKAKEDDSRIFITGFNEYYVQIHTMETRWVHMKELFEKYTFLDGRPCGFANSWKEDEE